MKSPKVDIELDWPAYFDAFCARHGEPVHHAGRLLFPDCWTYSATDHAGPEWAPPYGDKEQMRALATEYWKLRRHGLKEEAFRLRGMLAGLEELQQTRQVPLQHRMRIETEDEKGNVVSRTELRDVDLEGLRIALSRAEADLDEGHRQLESLKVKEGAVA